MTTENNKYVNLSYKLYTIEDGEKELVEEATSEHPFQFLTGFGTTLETFEEEIQKLTEGQSFDFTIPKEKAFGEYDDNHIYDLKREIFEVDGHFDNEHIKEGAVIPLENADHQHMNGIIIAVGPDTVKVDLNHPLAGADLNFVGEVLVMREATKDEIQGMINMMTEGCSCGCDSCGSDCEGGCGEHHCH